MHVRPILLPVLPHGRWCGRLSITSFGTTAFIIQNCEKTQKIKYYAGEGCGSSTRTQYPLVRYPWRGVFCLCTIGDDDNDAELRVVTVILYVHICTAVLMVPCTISAITYAARCSYRKTIAPFVIIHQPISRMCGNFLHAPLANGLFSSWKLVQPPLWKPRPPNFIINNKPSLLEFYRQHTRMHDRFA